MVFAAESCISRGTKSPLAIGALQMLLDRGELKDWFGSQEIWVEATIAGLALYLFIVHTVTATDRSFLNRDLLKDRNCMVGTVLMALIGIPLYGTMTLLPLMLQNLMNYPVVTTGMVTAPRGIGTMIAMFVVARLVGRVDIRLIILTGLLLAGISGQIALAQNVSGEWRIFGLPPPNPCLVFGLRLIFCAPSLPPWLFHRLAR